MQAGADRTGWSGDEVEVAGILITSVDRDREAARRLAEALRTGNPVENINDSWIDYQLAGAQDEHERSTQLLTTALALYEELGDKDGIATTYQYLGRVPIDRGEYEHAARYFQTNL